MDLSLENEGKCRPIPPYPVLVEGSFGLTYKEKTLICGGFDVKSDKYRDECHSFDTVEWKWKPWPYRTLSHRIHPKVFKIDEKRSLIMGGYKEGQVPVEMMREGGEFEKVEVDIPPDLDLESSCLVQIPGTEKGLFLGFGSWTPSYTFHWSNRSWTDLDGVPGIEVILASNHYH